VRDPVRLQVGVNGMLRRLGLSPTSPRAKAVRFAVVQLYDRLLAGEAADILIEHDPSCTRYRRDSTFRGCTCTPQVVTTEPQAPTTRSVQ